MVLYSNEVSYFNTVMVILLVAFNSLYIYEVLKILVTEKVEELK